MGEFFYLILASENISTETALIVINQFSVYKSMNIEYYRYDNLNVIFLLRFLFNLNRWLPTPGINTSIWPRSPSKLKGLRTCLTPWTKLWLPMPTSASRKGTSSPLHIRTPSDPEGPPGELSLPLKRRRNRRDPRTLVSSDPTNQKSKGNLIDIAMRSSTSLTIGSSLRQAMLKP